MSTHSISYFEDRLTQLVPYALLTENETLSLIGKLVLEAPEGVTPFLTSVLAGRFGKYIGALAYRRIENGIFVGNGNLVDASTPMLSSFAEVCMFKGRLDLLEATLNVTPRESSFKTRSLSTSDYLDFLCTTAPEREMDGGATLDAGAEGLVGLAARNWDICHHARSALDLAYKVNPEHQAWDSFFQQASEPGAFVREYQLNRSVADSSLGLKASHPLNRRAARVV
jgi:hypothetical protein